MVNERLYQARVSVDEASVEVGKAQEYLYVFIRFWFGPFSDRLHPDRVHYHPAWGDNETQEFHFLRRERTLGCFAIL